tara:strand:+ start:22060 stop:22914 length:855 start_codon:yes stop_codon:yes gene_type:complete
MTAMFGYDNRIAEATITAGSSAAGRGVEWLADRDMDESFQTIGVTEAETWLEMTYAAPVPIAILGAHGCNNSRYAEYRWRAWSDAEKTDLVHDSGWQELCPPMIAFPVRDWADPAFFTGRPPPRYWSLRPRQIVSVMPQTFRVAVARLEVKDNSLEAGFWNVARLFNGSKLAPTTGNDLGSQTGFDFTSQTQISRSGKRRVQEGIPARERTVKFSWLTEAERTLILDLQDRQGETGEVLWLPDPGDPVVIQRESYLATLNSTGVVRARNADEANTFDVKIKEWI